jgi:hypothetical protein
MQIVLWMIQAMLALAFVAAGLGKFAQPLESLHKNMEWTAAVPSALVRFILLTRLLRSM